MASMRVDDVTYDRKVGVELYDDGSDLVGLRLSLDQREIGSTVWTVEGARLLGRAILAMADTVADAHRDRREGKR